MDKPKKMGRPPTENPKVRMPGMMVDSDQLAAYKKAAKKSGSNFSQWVRDTLDRNTQT